VKRYFQLRTLAISVVFVSLHICIAQAASNRPPNVVIFLADDQGWGDLSLHGNPNLSTPNIDSIARDGAQVEHFYVCAVCSPTRAEFLTGRYHARMGVSGTSIGRERFSADEQTIAEVFRDNGYATAAYGKWHSGMQWPYHPNARGFEEFYGFCSGHWDNYYSPMLEHNGKIVQGNGFIIDDLTDHALNFIGQHKDKPFFLYLPFNTPHSPMQVPDPYWDRFENKEIQPDPAEANAKRQDLTHTRAALAMCENIDHNVGRVLKFLEASQLADDTIVIYFSDNGPNGFRFNGGMRGKKGSTNEGGLRSPCLIRYPKSIPQGSKVEQVSAAIDMLPTLVDLAGLKFDSRKPLDGVTIAPLLRQGRTDWPERLIFSTWNKRASVRSDRWRMQATGQLYDLKQDPRESNDVAAEHPEVQQRLMRALKEFKGTLDLAREDLPFVLGHPDAIFTQLPARDAVPHGGVIRNNRFPNSTYMTNWKSKVDEITWDVDVLAAGEFEVEMYYASASVGSIIELSLGDEKTIATIAVANNTDETGMEHDRFRRQEGYTKAWKPMKLGTMNLVPGRGKLTLKATNIVGDHVADMRLLMFRRIQ
jgi:arylsulfatase A-like enzyme